MSYENGHKVNVRTEPSAHSVSPYTYKEKYVGETGIFGYPIVIVDETTGSDGYVWYKIFSDANPPEQFGWVRSDLVQHFDAN